jgi:hypothetical protein
VNIYRDAALPAHGRLVFLHPLETRAPADMSAIHVVIFFCRATWVLQQEQLKEARGDAVFKIPKADIKRA